MVSEAPVVAVLPAASHLDDAVVAGGGRIVAVDDADVLVWTDPADPGGLASVLDEHPRLRWVQLPWAGIEPYVEVVRAHADRTWTCGKGVYAEPVAEHALTLVLACLRRPRPLHAGASLDRAAGGEPVRRPGDDPRRGRHHRVAPPVARAVRLRRDRRAADAVATARARPGWSARTGSRTR